MEGLGYAIPVNEAKDVVDELIENGYVTGRISIGVSVLDVSDVQTAMSYGLFGYGRLCGAGNGRLGSGKARHPGWGQDRIAGRQEIATSSDLE